jgi:hypothetical protein
MTSCAYDMPRSVCSVEPIFVLACLEGGKGGGKIIDSIVVNTGYFTNLYRNGR